CDELAAWKYPETWDQLLFGLRLGQHPQAVVTTTPKPTQLIKHLVSDPRSHVTRGRTMDNAANLAPSALARLKEKYEGTRLGRQELEAEILGDMPGALWSMSSLDAHRLREAPDCGRVVVSVDPAATNNPDSDEHGIIVAGLDGQRGVMIEDASLKGTPAEWARRAVSLYRSYGADGIVVEVNQGGDMVSHVLRSVDPNVNIIEVRASRGKHVRAEPIAALYEQGRIVHAGAFPDLETQMTQMTVHGYEGPGSPDRLDAMVWAFTELFPGMVDRVPDVSRFEIPRVAGGWMR
ncbi:MAG TPA: ATP-binding protein, partial [Accumulibacter sp.]|nr:ATP-binding protein [Accumulibacter sp.]